MNSLSGGSPTRSGVADGPQPKASGGCSADLDTERGLPSSLTAAVRWGSFHRHPDGTCRDRKLVILAFGSRVKPPHLQFDDTPYAVPGVNRPVIDLDCHGTPSILQAPRESSRRRKGRQSHTRIWRHELHAKSAIRLKPLYHAPSASRWPLLHYSRKLAIVYSEVSYNRHP